MIEDKRKGKAHAEGRHSSEPEKAHPSSELNIVAKNGDPSLLRLACSLANVIRLAGRQAGRQTKISVLAIF